MSAVIIVATHKTQNICITFVESWTKVEEVGPTLYKCYTIVLCLLEKTSINYINYICSRQNVKAIIRTIIYGVRKKISEDMYENQSGIDSHKALDDVI